MSSRHRARAGLARGCGRHQPSLSHQRTPPFDWDWECLLLVRTAAPRRAEVLWPGVSFQVSSNHEIIQRELSSAHRLLA